MTPKLFRFILGNRIGVSSLAREPIEVPVRR